MAGRPARLNISIFQGDDFELRLAFLDAATGLPQDLTGRSWAASYRPSYESVVVADFVIDEAEVAGGVVILRLPLANVIPLANKGVWDVAETIDGKTSRLLQGEVEYRKTVTR